MDIRSTESVEAWAETALTEWGRLDYAVANAGILRRDALAELSDEAWGGTLDVDLEGVMRTLRASASRIKGPGSLVSISAFAGGCEAGLWGWGGHTHYSAAEAGVLGSNRAVAVELTPSASVPMRDSRHHRNNPVVRSGRLPRPGRARGRRRGHSVRSRRHRCRGCRGGAVPSQRRVRLHHRPGVDRRRRTHHLHEGLDNGSTRSSPHSSSVARAGSARPLRQRSSPKALRW